jgi:hypothetical protein
MFKKIMCFTLYWHYLLDVLLTHVFVIAFLHMGYPFIASIFIATDSVFKIILSILIARMIKKLSPWSRGRLSLFCKCMFVILWFYALKNITASNILLSFSIIMPFLLFKFLMMIDNLMSAEFIFALRDLFKIDISQMTAAQLIFVRGGTAIAPAVALILLFKPNIQIMICIFVICIAVFSAYYFRKIYFSPVKEQSVSNTLILSLKNIIKNPFMRWGIAYQILANIAFAGVAFLLLAKLQQTSNFFLNDITLLYISFFIIQCWVLIFGENIIPVKTTLGMGFLMGITGLFVLIVSQFHGYIRLVSCLGIGVSYSISLSALQIILTSRLQGSYYTEYMGWSQTVGRLTSLVITTSIGFAMRSGFSSSTLLFLCGLMGMFSALMLQLLPIKKPHIKLKRSIVAENCNVHQ